MIDGEGVGAATDGAGISRARTIAEARGRVERSVDSIAAVAFVAVLCAHGNKSEKLSQMGAERGVYLTRSCVRVSLRGAE